MEQAMGRTIRFENFAGLLRATTSEFECLDFLNVNGW